MRYILLTAATEVGVKGQGSMMSDEVVKLISVFGTLLSAIISAYALIKVNKIDNQDRVRRSLWAFEQYLQVVGKCIENATVENLQEYKSYYTMNKIYVRDELYDQIKKIDVLISKEKWEAVESEVDQLTRMYSEIYNMDKFSPRKRF